MREMIEVYRWMWREVDLQYEGSFSFRLALFVEAVTTDLVRSLRLTAIRATTRGGVGLGRVFRGPLLPATVRGTVGVALCAALFSPFLTLLGEVTKPTRSFVRVTVVEAGFVDWGDTRLTLAEFGKVLDAQRIFSLEVRIAGPSQQLKGRSAQSVVEHSDVRFAKYVYERDHSGRPDPATE